MGTRAGGLRALLIYHQEHLVLSRKAFYVPFPVVLLSTRTIKACPDTVTRHLRKPHRRCANTPKTALSKSISRDSTPRTHHRFTVKHRSQSKTPGSRPGVSVRTASVLSSRPAPVSNGFRPVVPAPWRRTPRSGPPNPRDRGCAGATCRRRGPWFAPPAPARVGS
jgi:hypothetical protein